LSSPTKCPVSAISPTLSSRPKRPDLLSAPPFRRVGRVVEIVAQSQRLEHSGLHSYTLRLSTLQPPSVTGVYPDPVGAVPPSLCVKLFSSSPSVYLTPGPRTHVHLHILQKSPPSTKHSVGSIPTAASTATSVLATATIAPAQSGFCFIRRQPGRQNSSARYASPAALQVDPNRKKPLTHFLPARNLQHSTAGCNMAALRQNGHLQIPSRSVNSKHLPPRNKFPPLPCNTAAIHRFTYNEPTIWRETSLTSASRQASRT